MQASEALRWHKSSYSGGSNQDCVEVAELPDVVLVRDTQNTDLGHLGFRGSEWAAFVGDVKTGDL